MVTLPPDVPPVVVQVLARPSTLQVYPLVVSKPAGNLIMMLDPAGTAYVS